MGLWGLGHFQVWDSGLPGWKVLLEDLELDSGTMGESVLLVFFLLKAKDFVKGVQNSFVHWGCVLWFAFACKDFSILSYPIYIEIQVFKIDYLKANVH